MSGATEAGKHALASFVAAAINNSPPVNLLRLFDTNFSSSDMEAIREALISRNVRTLTNIQLYANPTGFDTDAKCLAWSTWLRNLSGLKDLDLRGCDISAENQERIRKACPMQGCSIGF